MFNYENIKNETNTMNDQFCVLTDTNNRKNKKISCHNLYILKEVLLSIYKGNIMRI